MLSKSMILKFIYRLNITAIKFPYAFVCVKHDKLIQNLCYHCSVTQLCATLCNPMDCNTSGLPVITNSQSLLKLMSIESGMPSKHLILCCPLLLPPSILPSLRIFSNESALHNRWPKYWSFSSKIYTTYKTQE